MFPVQLAVAVKLAAAWVQGALQEVLVGQVLPAVVRELAVQEQAVLQVRSVQSRVGLGSLVRLSSAS